jgi:hypothetical protein
MKGKTGYYWGLTPNSSNIYLKNPQDSTTITHELIHHAQHKDEPWLYGPKYIWNALFDSGHPMNNPYEREAHLNEKNSQYLKNRPKNAVDNYKSQGGGLNRKNKY